MGGLPAFFSLRPLWTILRLAGFPPARRMLPLKSGAWLRLETALTAPVWPFSLELSLCQGENWDGRTRLVIESMEEKAAYIPGGQGPWQGC
jgi:hypothetical protein